MQLSVHRAQACPIEQQLAARGLISCKSFISKRVDGVQSISVA